MAFKAYAHIQGYQVKEIAKLYEDGAVEPACRLTAIHLARVARNNFRALTKSTGRGELLKDIRAKKGKYDDLTWLYGVMGGVNPPANSHEWEESTGGRAHFFEYGRSAPGKGKKRGQRPQPRSRRPQPPRPFLRTTLYEGKRKLFGVTSKEVAKITKRIRTGRIPKKVVRRILS